MGACRRGYDVTMCHSAQFFSGPQCAAPTSAPRALTPPTLAGAVQEDCGCAAGDGGAHSQQAGAGLAAPGVLFALGWSAFDSRRWRCVVGRRCTALRAIHAMYCAVYCAVYRRRTWWMSTWRQPTQPRVAAPAPAGPAAHASVRPQQIALSLGSALGAASWGGWCACGKEGQSCRELRPFVKNAL